MLVFRIACLFLISVAAKAELTTVPFVDLNQYVGTWYQIAKNPIFFENGCVCSRQVLTPTQDGRVQVHNSCNNLNPSGSLREIRGYATVDDTVSNAKLIVDFNLPKKGTYWIIGLDSQYRYAVVSDANKASLFILSKTPQLEESLYREAVNKAAEQIDISNLTLMSQTNCVYP